MYRMSNLNKLKDFYQIFEKNSRLCFMRKKVQGLIRNVLNIFIGPRSLSPTPLCANVYKMYECDKNQMPYCSVKKFKKSNFKNFGPLIKHGPH
jgi:hypothetical protein